MPPFQDYENAFRYVAQQAQKDRLILIVDEHPYLAAGEPSISSILQRCIDLYFKQGQGFLILCGSSMSFMEQQVLDAKSPLYGRWTAQYKIYPFSFKENCQYFADQTAEEKAVYYGITGGIAAYMDFIDPERSIDDNIIRLYFERRDRLYEEPPNLLHQELRDPRSYNDILAAIAGSASKNNEIASKLQQTPANINPYLKSLMELHIVSRSVSVGNQGSTKPVYSIDDQMYRFWYRFVYPNRRFIELDRGADIYRQVVEDQISSFIGHLFEKIVHEYLQLPSVRQQFPGPVNNEGRWWGTDPVLRQKIEIDYVGLGSGWTVLAEAKWRNEWLSDSVYLDLLEKGRQLYGEKTIFLFSKSDFSASLKERAKGDPKLNLVTYAEMLKAFNVEK